ncbi:dTDP-3,4-didehydro-2,6-dideoxy-alpha-D-glucose 3-reductase [Lentibacillus sp. JNUCC-1]|uniref:Gfo/Idh/MocA family protein n=1 Tax=Lentibacillus sp. JNUCC-1 TaxID=2654513 RepID=UPI0012E8F2E6|nr:Gfo/Idh/MocA family oxidoreductase [Lentibacillus sp. JNUCC-1]MUV37198.1 dTDP-3,4-didehydro-2,6-dideoxy-alpha-D-glucose 3-reductase [Lentibacillus sp. JNUCC-1]
MSITAGIIGCGSITRYRHAPEYKANPHVSKIVFYDRNPERAEALAELFGGTTAGSVEALLNDPEIDVISDCSSNEYHHIHTTNALLNGKHVLCEKPLSLTLEQAEGILSAQEQSGKKLMVDHNQRLTKAHQEVKRIIKNNELGKPLTFKTTFGHQGPEHWGFNKSNSTWFFKKERSGLGVAGDLGIHKIDLIHYLLDDEIEYVSAFKGALDKVDENDQPIQVADNIVCSLKTKKGVLGSASFSWTYYGEEDNSTIIYCEHGIIKIYTHPDHQIEVIRSDGGKVHYQLESIQTNDNQSNTGVIDAFIKAVRLDEEPVVTGHDAFSSLKVILGILEAADTQKIVKI